MELTLEIKKDQTQTRQSKKNLAGDMTVKVQEDPSKMKNGYHILRMRDNGNFPKKRLTC